MNTVNSLYSNRSSFQSFHSQTRRELTSCFTPHIQNAVDADECLFKEMKDL